MFKRVILQVDVFNGIYKQLLLKKSVTIFEFVYVSTGDRKAKYVFLLLLHSYSKLLTPDVWEIFPYTSVNSSVHTSQLSSNYIQFCHQLLELSPITIALPFQCQLQVPSCHLYFCPMCSKQGKKQKKCIANRKIRKSLVDNRF